MQAKNLSVRLPGELYAQTMTIAMVDHVSVGEVIRDALQVYASHRSADDDFKTKAKSASMDFQQQVHALIGLTD